MLYPLKMISLIIDICLVLIKVVVLQVRIKLELCVINNDSLCIQSR